jgi:transposase InsO family protein
MADTTTNSVRIEPLKGTDNIIVWSVRVKDLLRSQKLWKYVDGTAPKPTEGAADQTAWAENDQSALTLIRLRVTDAPLMHIASAEDSKTAWDRLMEIYQPKGAIGSVLARKKFFQTQCSEGGDIREHIQLLRTYQQQLASLGKVISERDFSVTLLTSLPTSWHSFASSISTDTLKSSHSTIARVLEEDARLRDQTGNTTSDTALATGPPQVRHNPRIKCYKCGKRGHIQAQCRSGGQRHWKPRNRPSLLARLEGDVAFSALNTENPDEVPELVERRRREPENVWVADTGASSHTCYRRDAFITYEPCERYVEGFGGALVKATGIGTVKLEMPTANGTSIKLLHNTLHVPNSGQNLFSLTRATSAGYRLAVNDRQLLVVNRYGDVVAIADRVGSLYHMRVTNSQRHNDSALVATSAQPRSWQDWHRVLGHLHMGGVKQLVNSGMVDGMEVDRSSPIDFQCTSCITGKQRVAPFPKESKSAAQEVGDLIVADLWGPARVRGIRGAEYYSDFKDVGSRFGKVYFLTTKSPGALDSFRDFDAWFERQSGGRKIRRLRVDNGTEFVNSAFRSYLAAKGITLETTAPHSSAQNGIAERYHLTLLNRARTMLIEKNIPLFLWPEAVSYANYLLNRSPSRSLGSRTPYEAFYGKKPNISQLREFGSKCWVLQQDGQNHKLMPRSREMIFMGISEESTAWRYYNPGTRQVQTSRNIVFAESTAADAAEGGDHTIVVHPAPLEGENITANDEQAPDAPINNTNATPPKSRRSNRLHGKPQTDYRRLGNPDARPAEPRDAGNVATEFVLMSTITVDEPTSYEDAMQRSDSEQWKGGMDKEMDLHKRIGTWELVECPDGRTPIGSRWVFRLKRDGEGNIKSHKSRLVAQGFSQVYGLDYFDTFSAVVRPETIRLLIALATRLDWEIHAMDVVGAYLNGELEEEIYMKQAPGYDDGTGRVCRLRRSLYGLKQSGRVWNQKLNNTIKARGFTPLSADPCAYARSTSGGVSIIAVHVDDMILVTSNTILMVELKSEMKEDFDVSDLGPAGGMTGTEIARNRTCKTTTLTQRVYVAKVLERFGMIRSNPSPTPLDPKVKLVKAEETASDELRTHYQSVIGSLMFAALGTRPDIAFAVQHLSQFSSNPDNSHLTAAKRVLRYLNGTRNLGITYSDTGDIKLTGYSDADWAADLTDRRSTSGFVFMLAGGPITWSSKKQPTVALSTMEAEYMALSHATREVIWLRNVLNGLGFTQEHPNQLYTDNQGAIDFANGHSIHARSKHIDIRHHFVRESIASRLVTVDHCASAENLADLLTKALDGVTLRGLLARYGM